MKAPVLTEFIRDRVNDELHLRLPENECRHGFVFQDVNASCECWKKVGK